MPSPHDSLTFKLMHYPLVVAAQVLLTVCTMSVLVDTELHNSLQSHDAEQRATHIEAQLFLSHCWPASPYNDSLNFLQNSLHCCKLCECGDWMTVIICTALQIMWACWLNYGNILVVLHHCCNIYACRADLYCATCADIFSNSRMCCLEPVYSVEIHTVAQGVFSFVLSRAKRKPTAMHQLHPQKLLAKPSPK